MNTGYVLRFSDRTFREFVHDSMGLDIDDPNVGGVGSKAHRLRHFWNNQPDYIVGKLLKCLVESVEADPYISDSFGAIRFGTSRPPALGMHVSGLPTGFFNPLLSATPRSYPFYPSVKSLTA